jgi:hypothetical protein
MGNQEFRASVSVPFHLLQSQIHAVAKEDLLWTCRRSR